MNFFNIYTKKEIRIIVIVCLIWGIVIFLYQICDINNFYRGFAVDDNRQLYVGKTSKIDVYENNEFVKTFKKVGAAIFSFTINDERLYLAAFAEVQVMDLSGNLIERIDDSAEPSEFYRLRKERKEFVTDEAKYVATEIFGYYKITKYSIDGEKEVVYRMPTFDYVYGWIMIISNIGYGVMIIKVFMRPISQRRRK